jgi:hypothetical protein
MKLTLISLDNNLVELKNLPLLAVPESIKILKHGKKMKDI